MSPDCEKVVDLFSQVTGVLAEGSFTMQELEDIATLAGAVGRAAGAASFRLWMADRGLDDERAD